MLRILKSGGQTAIAFNAPALADYVGELELSVTPGSRFAMYWGLRSANSGDEQYLLGIHTVRQAMWLSYFDARAGLQQPLTPPLPVQDLQTGRVVRLGVVMDSGRALLYLDGQEIAQAIDGRITGATVPSIGIEGEEGSVRITRARFWALP